MSETKDQTIARHDQHTAWKEGIDTIECDTDCRACTIARLTQEVLDAKSNTAAFCGEVVTLRAELAASREIGPCGKHPKMFWNRGRAPSAGSPLPEIEPYCTICAELAASRVDVIRLESEIADICPEGLSLRSCVDILTARIAERDQRIEEMELQYRKVLDVTTSDAAAREEWIRPQIKAAEEAARQEVIRLLRRNGCQEHGYIRDIQRLCEVEGEGPLADWIRRIRQEEHDKCVADFNAILDRRIAALCATPSDAREERDSRIRQPLLLALLSIEEYWNGHENQTAMSDAVYEMRERATQALEPFRAKLPSAPVPTAREEWIRRIRLEEAKDIRREQNLRISKSFMDWLDDHIIELKTPLSLENREQRADRFKRESGKKVHASDCATSVAPAEEPGPCDCDEPQSVPAAQAGDAEFCRHKEINNEGICKACGAKAAIWLPISKDVSGCLVDMSRIQDEVKTGKEEIAVCPLCKGVGILYGATEPCPDCHGTGKRESK